MNSKSVKEGGKHNMYSKSKRFIASFLAVLMAVCMLPVDMFGAVGVVNAAAGDLTATMDGNNVSDSTDVAKDAEVKVTLATTNIAATDIIWNFNDENAYGEDFDLAAYNAITENKQVLTETTKSAEVTIDTSSTDAPVKLTAAVVEHTTEGDEAVEVLDSHTYIFNVKIGISATDVVLGADSVAAGNVPTLTVTVGGTELTADDDYTVTYSINVDGSDVDKSETDIKALTEATTVKVTVTGKGNYTGSVTKTFNVTAGPGEEVTVGTVTANPTTNAQVDKDSTVTLSYDKGTATAEADDIQIYYKKYKTSEAPTQDPAAADITDEYSTPIVIAEATTIYAVAKTKVSGDETAVCGGVAKFTYTVKDDSSNPNPPAGQKLNRKLDMGTLATGDITSELTKNGFTIMPTLKNSEESRSLSGVDYTKRVQLGKLTNATSLNADRIKNGKVTGAIKFDAQEGAQVKIIGRAGTSGTTTNVWVCKLEGEGETLSLAKVKAFTSGDPESESASNLGATISLAEAELEEAGTYYVVNATNASSYNLFYIEVKYEGVDDFTDDTTVRVTFNANGGTAVEHQDVVTGQKCTEPGSILDGKVLLGWYKDEALTQKFDFATDTVSADMTLYAKWDTDGNRVLNTLNISDLPAGTYNNGFDKNGFTVGTGVSISAENATLGTGDDAVTYTKVLKFGGASATKSGNRDFVFDISAPSILTVVAASGKDDGRILKVAKITITGEGEEKTETEDTVEEIMAAAQTTISKKEMALTDAGKYRIYATGDFKIYYVSVVAGSMLNAPSITPAAGTTALDRDTEIEITHNNTTGTLQYSVNDGEFKNYTDKLVLGNLVADEVTQVTIKAKVIPADGDTTTNESPVTTVNYTIKPVGGVTPPGPVDPDDPDVPDDVPENGLYVRFVDVDADGKAIDYTYTGAKVEPAIEVYNNRNLLTLGTDYTVKYKNNINAATSDSAKAPSVTVTGKGNLSGSAEVITFTIKPADISDVASYPENMTVAVNTKVSPVIMHGTKKLGNKDFTLEGEGLDKGKYAAATESGATNTLKVKGINNYAGSEAEIAVKVVDKKDLQKLKVAVDTKTKLNYGEFSVESISELVVEPSANGGGSETSMQTEESGAKKIITVTDAKGTVLTENTDFVIYTASSLNAAGTVKFTVVGMGAYGGTVNKSFKINPAKITDNTKFEVSFDETEAYEFKASGVTVDGLTVKYLGATDASDDDVTLTAGVDYKVAYSNNKKVSTDTKKAQVKITFLGNYKGSKAVSKPFTIVKATMDAGEDGNTVVVVPNKVYSKPNKAYKSTPIVMVDGVAIKASNYEVHYSWKSASDDTYKDDDKVKITLSGDDTSANVKVTIKPKDKSSYALAEADGTPVTIEGEYDVVALGDKAIDLSKAKVEFTDKDGKTIKSVEYTGKPINELEGDDAVNVKVTPKGASEALSSDLYTVEWTNATEKGKATIVVNGTGTADTDGNYAIGSKNASISIKAQSIKKALLNNKKPVVADAFKGVLDMIF